MNTFKCLLLHNLWIHSKIHTFSCTVYKQIFCILPVAHHSTVCACVLYIHILCMCTVQQTSEFATFSYSFIGLLFIRCFLLCLSASTTPHSLYIYYHSMRNSSFCTHFRLTMPLFIVKSTSGNKCSC